MLSSEVSKRHLSKQSAQQQSKMHRVSLPELERHPWDVTEALGSCLTNQQHGVQFTTKATLQPKRLQVLGKTPRAKEYIYFQFSSSSIGACKFFIRLDVCFEMIYMKLCLHGSMSFPKNGFSETCEYRRERITERGSQLISGLIFHNYCVSKRRRNQAS